MADFDNKLDFYQDEEPAKGAAPKKVKREKVSKQQERMLDGLGEVAVRRVDANGSGFNVVSDFFNLIYNFLYVVGVLVIRIWYRIANKLNLRVSRARGEGHSIIHRGQMAVKRWASQFMRNAKQPFTRFRENWVIERASIASAKAAGEPVWRKRRHLAALVLEIAWKIIRVILNYAAPIVAAVFLLSVIRSTLDTSLGLKVTYKDEDIGYIRSEDEFGRALEDVEIRIVADTESDYTSGVPRYEVVEMPNIDDFTPSGELANGILRASSGEIQEGYAVYVNNELLGAVAKDDGDDIYLRLQQILAQNSTGEFEERVVFQKNVSYDGGLFPQSSIVSKNELMNLVNSNETEEESYLAREGDTFDTIALRNGTTVANLKKLNSNLGETVNAGETILVSKAVPLLSVQNVYIYIYIKEVDFKSEKTVDTLYAPGYANVTRAGIPGTGRVTAEITAIDGVEVAQNILSVEHLTNPTTELVTIGGVSQDPTEGFLWPGRNGYISCYVGGYPGHAGIDIAGTGGIGSPVYASASGTVIKASWGFVGYGNHIMIDHGNGFQTLYAHTSNMYVAMGDYVGKGQIIAAVGDTGWATGPHIHFEVIQGGQKLNPVNFVGAR